MSVKFCISERYTLEPHSAIGKFIVEQMKEQGITLEEFARRMGISPSKARKIILTRDKGISYETMISLTKALELEKSAFIDFVGTNNKITKSEVGGKIRNKRKAKGKSLKQLASKLGIKKQYLSQIELGKVTLCSRKEKVQHLIKQLAEFVEMDGAEFRLLIPKRKFKKNPQTLLGKAVRCRRLERGLTQEELADLIGVSPSLISDTELGKYYPGLEFIEKTARALNARQEK